MQDQMRETPWHDAHHPSPGHTWTTRRRPRRGRPRSKSVNVMLEEKQRTRARVIAGLVKIGRSTQRASACSDEYLSRGANMRRARSSSGCSKAGYRGARLRPWDDVVNDIIDAGHTRVPAYEKNRDNVVGILYSKDLLPELAKDADEPRRPIRELLRKPLFVPETKSVKDLLELFQESRTHIAIVMRRSTENRTMGLMSLMAVHRVARVPGGPERSLPGTSTLDGRRRSGRGGSGRPARFRPRPWFRPREPFWMRQLGSSNAVTVAQFPSAELSPPCK